VEFYKSDRHNSDVFKRNEENLSYLSESWVPTKKDSRLPVLLLFGNPASHSVVARMYFSYEGKGREHRIWRIFREVSLLNWVDPLPVVAGSLFDSSKVIKKRFFDLDYNSPFRLAMVVYFSMPSAPSEPSWSGVNGLCKLFGRKAIRLIENEEQKRIRRIVENFMPDGGVIIAFQKDAYNGVVTKEASGYSLRGALAGELEAKSGLHPKVKVFGVPPTRFLQGRKAKQVLKDIIVKAQG